MSRNWRLLLGGTTLALLLLYFPINRLVSGGVSLVTPLDAYIPLWPAWALPYLLTLPAIVAAMAWLTLRLEERLFQAFITACWAAILPSFLLFMAWPTHVFRPPVPGSGFSASLLRFVYSADRVNNAFPSAHVFMGTLLCLFLGRAHPRLRPLWALLYLLTALSTLFTHQHHLLDVLGGMAVGWLAYRIGLWLAEVEPLVAKTRKVPPGTRQRKT